EAVERIRAAERSGGARRTPIIALTAGGFLENYEKRPGAGMDGFLTKPPHPGEILAAPPGRLAPMSRIGVVANSGCMPFQRPCHNSVLAFGLLIAPIGVVSRKRTPAELRISGMMGKTGTVSMLSRTKNPNRPASRFNTSLRFAGKLVPVFK